MIEVSYTEDMHSCCGDGSEMPTECCEMEQEIVKHDENVLVSFQNIEPPSQVVLYSVDYPHLTELVIEQNPTINNILLPPLAVPERLSRYQSFLI